MTYEEYVKEVRKHFRMGANDPKEVDKYFEETDTVEVLKDNYKCYSKGLEGSTPSAVAYCLDLLW